MRRSPLYSRSGKPRGAGASQWVAPDGLSPILALPEEADGPSVRQRVGLWWRQVYTRYPGRILVASSVVVSLALVSLWALLEPPAQNLTQTQLNAAVNYAIDQRPRAPSVASVAYANVIRSVVQVNAYNPGETPRPKNPAAEIDPGKEGFKEDFHEKFTAVGSGVVIDDLGTILTNLHVAAAAEKLRVVFWDGTEADAAIVGVRPDNDLAVIQPRVLPDDLMPATLASTRGLLPGDEVVAVGFPFGIGPSASAGVISGLGREFGEEGGAKMTNLIQFDAAANPGNSGGPLVNADGEVIGIVTAILNPSGVRTFLGIGFAVPIESAAAAAGESPL